MKKAIIIISLLCGMVTTVFSETLYVVIETPEQRAQRQLVEAIAALDRERMQRAELEGLTELLILIDREDVNEAYLRTLRMDLFRDSQELFRQNQITSRWMWTTAISGTLLASIFGIIWFVDFLDRNDDWHDPIMNRGLSGGLTLTGLGMISTGIILEVRLNTGRFNLHKMETQLRVLNSVLNF